MNYKDVLHFWFSELKEKDWFKKDSILDTKIKERFSHLYYQAIQAELFEWRSSIQGRLAEIILLDQFSRNIFRDKAQSFS